MTRPVHCPAIVLCLAALAGGAHGQSPASATRTVRGRLVDATSMVRSLRPDDLAAHGGGGLLESLPRIPAANRPFRLHLIEGPTRGKTWEGTTDADGRFEIPIDVPDLPPARCLVAEVTGEAPLFSPAVAPARDEIEFRCYRTTDSDRYLRDTEMHVHHSIKPGPAGDRLDLEVEVQAVIVNASGEMYVGNPRRLLPGESRTASREVLRVPVPLDAVLQTNQGPSGETWTEYPADGGFRWLVIDSPILPLLESPDRGFWELRYRVPASQEMASMYPVSLGLNQFVAWGIDKDVGVASPALPGGPKKMRHAANAGDPPLEWTAVFGRELKAGSDIPLGITVDNARLGQVNRGSLLILLGFMLAAALAMVLGLLLARKKPSLEALLEEATGDELIARIAQLDIRRERGEVPEEEYLDLRSKLLSLARYAVPELAAADGKAVEPGAAARLVVLPPAAQALLERLRALEGSGPLDSQRIHERVILLEELAKALRGAGDRAEMKGRESAR